MSLSLYTDNHLVWSRQYNDAELIAGMMAASLSCLNDHPGTNLSTDIDLRPFLAKQKILVDFVPLNSIVSQGWYGLWMNSSTPGYLDLYTFQTPQFMQGVISYCQAANVDFRSVIYDFIFDHQHRKHTLNGYLIQQLRLAVVVENSYDVEEEEKDNENIQAPYPKPDQ